MIRRFLSRANRIIRPGPDPVSDLRAVLPQLPDIPYESLVERLDATVRPHLFVLASKFNRQFVFRARLNEDNQSFSKVSKLGYMPPNLLHLLRTFGRANKPQEAMFYASTQPFVACVETARDVYSDAGPDGLGLTVGTWRIVEPLVVASLLASPTNLRKMQSLQGAQGTGHSAREIYDRIKSAKKENTRLEAAVAPQESRQNRRASIELLRFFSDEFARLDAENWHFKLTNYFKDFILQFPEIDGIWYESVGYTFQYSNLALTPQAVEKKLRFECASSARMDAETHSGSVRFRVLQEDVPADADGKIAWYQNRNEMSGAHRIASIRSLADLAEAKLAPDRGERPELSCLCLLVFAPPEVIGSGIELQTYLDQLHGKCGNRTLVLFVGYGKAVPFDGQQQIGGGWLFSEGLFKSLSEHVAHRTAWRYHGALDILAFPILLIQQAKWWSVEFHFDAGGVVDWKRAQSQMINPMELGDFLSKLYDTAEAKWDDFFSDDDSTRMLKIMASVLPRETLIAMTSDRGPSPSFRLAGARTRAPKFSVPVRWKHPD